MCLIDHNADDETTPSPENPKINGIGSAIIRCGRMRKSNTFSSIPVGSPEEG
jgi:hypothetical protein